MAVLKVVRLAFEKAASRACFEVDTTGKLMVVWLDVKTVGLKDAV